jgi:hypothetical protein
MKPAGTIEAGGQKALAHNRAVQIMAHGFGEKDTRLGRATLVTKGHYMPWTWEIPRLCEDRARAEKNITRMTGD